jgi:ribA/ribD-fused uncharacterized protein
MDTILFSRISDAFGFMSNFAHFPMVIDNKSWPTSEHYYQSCKFEDENIREKIRTAKSPMMAAKIGRDSKSKIRDGWDSLRVSIMRKAVLEKFSQNTLIGERLIATGDATLIEHTSRDPFWADGGDGSGRNMLGIILMEVREKIKGQMKVPP